MCTHGRHTLRGSRRFPISKRSIICVGFSCESGETDITHFPWFGSQRLFGHILHGKLDCFCILRFTTHSSHAFHTRLTMLICLPFPISHGVALNLGLERGKTPEHGGARMHGMGAFFARARAAAPFAPRPLVGLALAPRGRELALRGKTPDPTASSEASGRHAGCRRQSYVQSQTWGGPPWAERMNWEVISARFSFASLY